MASDMQPKGNWIFRILIIVLFVVMLTSINYPKKLWNEQDDLTLDSRERMENLNYVVQRYFEVKGFYQPNLDSLLSFIKSDSITVTRPLYEIERLSLFDADSDSFLIGFLDRFHYEKLDAELVTEDSLVISMVPKEDFTGVITPAKMAMVAEKGIQSYERGKGDDDIYHIVYSRGKIQRYDIPFDTLVIPSIDYLIYRDLDEIVQDPITTEKFELTMNARITVEGKVEYKDLKDPETDLPLLENELMSNLLVNKLARSARAKLDAALKKDSTLYEQQLSLQSDYMEVELSTLRPGKVIEIDQSKEISIPLDEVGTYDDEALIKKELFHTVYDSLIRVWTDWPQVQERFGTYTFLESYGLTKLDTIGITIQPPFAEEYSLPASSLLDKIFSVGPIENPGNVENNDLSWDEKR